MFSASLVDHVGILHANRYMLFGLQQFRPTKDLLSFPKWPLEVISIEKITKHLLYEEKQLVSEQNGLLKLPGFKWSLLKLNY